MFADLEFGLRKLIETRLPEFAIAYENILFTPPKDAVYLKLNFLPAEVSSFTLSRKEKIYQGMMQVMVVAPPLVGSDNAKLIADRVAGVMAEGQKITVSAAGVNAYISQDGQVFPAVPGDSSYSIPVRCYYRADKPGA